MATEFPSLRHKMLDRATSALTPPFAVIDLAALDTNRHDLRRRGAQLPIRVASKSLRCRWALRQILSHQGFVGVLGFTAREAIWLATPTAQDPGIDDVVIGYPSVDHRAIAQIAADPLLRERITLMVDDPEHVRMAGQAATAVGGSIRVCIDVDSSWRPRYLPGSPHIGARRSPLHEAESVKKLVDIITSTTTTDLVGLMFYEAQIAGVGNKPSGQPLRGKLVTAMQRASERDLQVRRPAIIADVADRLARAGRAQLKFVNAGGTGSLEFSASDPSVTELTAGSGFYAPTLFDSYSHFTPTPATFFALPVVRRPAPGIVTVLGGGYVASGTADKSRLPTPVYPAGLHLDSQEGAGEVQTPLIGDAADSISIGDLVWFRHAKAGELAERFAAFHLVRDGEHVMTVPTYRGEGETFL